jgi:hypothetical protein
MRAAWGKRTNALPHMPHATPPRKLAGARSLPARTSSPASCGGVGGGNRLRARRFARGHGMEGRDGAARLPDCSISCAEGTLLTAKRAGYTRPARARSEANANYPRGNRSLSRRAGPLCGPPGEREARPSQNYTIVRTSPRRTNDGGGGGCQGGGRRRAAPNRPPALTRDPRGAAAKRR